VRIRVGHKFGVAQQVGDVLHRVARKLKAKQALRRSVAPLNAHLRIEQHDAIGRRLNGCQKLLQTLLLGCDLAALVAPKLGRPLARIAPRPQVFDRIGLRAAHPAAKALRAHGIVNRPSADAQGQNDPRVAPVVDQNAQQTGQTEQQRQPPKPTQQPIHD
jgi:hypothetical protein